MSAIADSNITTLLAAGLLFFLASGPVCGFGVTLTIGVLASMFTALVLTRVLASPLMGSRWAQRRPGLSGLASIGWVRRKPTEGNPDIMGRRRVWLAIAGVATVLALAGIGVRGLNVGVEFTGGRAVEYAAAAPMSADTARDAVTSAGLDRAVVNTSGDGNISVRAGNFDEDIEAEIRSALTQAGGGEVQRLRDERIGPTLGAELRRNAVIALGVALAAQLVYLAIRFRWQWGAAAVLAAGVHPAASQRHPPGPPGRPRGRRWSHPDPRATTGVPSTCVRTATVRIYTDAPRPAVLPTFPRKRRRKTARMIQVHGRDKMNWYESAGKARGLAIVGGVAVAVLVGASAPASAAVPGYSVVVTSSNFDATDFKTAPDAVCPSGKVLIGTGYTTSSGLANPILVDEVIPLGNPSASARVGAAEADATSNSSWSVSANAICANPVPGLQKVVVNSDFDSADSKLVVAKCPAGKKAIGTGYSVNGSAGKIVINSVFPEGTPTAAPTLVQVLAMESDPVAASWSVQAFAVCANPLAGLVQVMGSSLRDSSPVKSATAQCPAGKVVTGTGHQINGPIASIPQLSTDSVRPSGSNTSVVVRAVEEDSVADNWWVLAVAICANR